MGTKLVTAITVAQDIYQTAISRFRPSGARCDNCETIMPMKDVVPLDECPDLECRLEPGSIVPDGECPKCGAFCYRV